MCKQAFVESTETLRGSELVGCPGQCFCRFGHAWHISLTPGTAPLSQQQPLCIAAYLDVLHSLVGWGLVEPSAYVIVVDKDTRSSPATIRNEKLVALQREKKKKANVCSLKDPLWKSLGGHVAALRSFLAANSQAASIMSSIIAVSCSPGWLVRSGWCEFWGSSSSSGSSGTSTIVPAVEYEGGMFTRLPLSWRFLLRQHMQCRQSCTLYLKRRRQGWQNW